MSGLRRALALVLLLFASTAAGQRLEDRASGIALTPPAGYSASPVAEPETDGVRAVFDVERDGDAETGCRVSTVRAPGNALMSQAELNARADSPVYQEQVIAALSPRYEIQDVRMAISASIVGLVVIGDDRETLDTPGATPRRALLIFIDTPLQRVFIACVAPRAVFEERLPEFEAMMSRFELN